jgi:hypothetical protein
MDWVLLGLIMRMERDILFLVIMKRENAVYVKVP